MGRVLRVIHLDEAILEKAGEIAGLTTTTFHNRNLAVEAAIEWAHDVWTERQMVLQRMVRVERLSMEDIIERYPPNLGLVDNG